MLFEYGIKRAMGEMVGEVAKSLLSDTDQLKQFVNYVLRSDKPSLVRIRLFFEHLLNEMAGDPEEKGCLLVIILLETPPEDEEINQRSSRALGYVEHRFCEVLAEAQAGGEVASGRDSATLARLLMTGIFGLRVYHKMRPQREELDAVVDSLLSSIGKLIPVADACSIVLINIRQIQI